ncbi:FtsW/RodA/SpoVE family cell cycle protein [Staphylococcus pseudoxylosus]|uniref:Probable peptidoglycan glycosyltransferase FtsW n=1 Tax=Staphylococcus pseudoxylosus TaxID=2282419 RepID=A0AAQ0MKX4_9STAP|nr:FtsW/RodA/SpoVE family cell cycle protein [Staphylococcus pseudoxylosus]MBM2658246.1 FtsW/RodA/SpoVE family cell cycle protein [Staphylococcus pseudoxylosus]MCE5003301.1 FtsW/RodA/SpoVE family cell cycle protein [Staphylococcus pseudoxylosus]MDW8547140.1 FtsW/RodA/SpoVE family cell cycle protein [Staphylococcus pseudoxylosus]MEB6169070.1 FtsW/RodA/SpoVE family cell cycle protein [Staphylococcus pseudoxylosus]RMI86574.1 FtsW/RodA/SpoVE family cell cycle protein [Staphylococcus pseudoxylosus]
MLNILKGFKKRLKHLDIGIIISFIILSVIGVIMVYSASMVPASKGSLTNGTPIEANYFMKRQFIFFILSVCIILFISMYFNIKMLRNTSTQKFLIVGTFALLILTLLIGKDVNGSRNWINLGLFSLQSSEFLKLVAIFYLSFILDKKLTNNRDYKLKNIVPPLGILGVGLVLVLMQGDLGGTLLTVAIIVAILMYSDIKNKIKIQILTITSIPVVLYIIYTLVFDSKNLYRMKRIKVVLDPFKYENGDGYQLTNALVSISNGGVFGRGLGNGILKLGYLPEPHTDFIFTVISEELGLIGVLLILLMYGFIILKGFIYANKTRNHFYKLICVGVVSYLFMQVFVNIGGVSGLIPLTGVTLPLLSYGGSSMLSISIALGILLAVIREIKKETKVYE